MSTRRFDDQFTRRAALRGLGLGGVAVALAARGAGAQDATPAASPAALSPLLAEWAAAWSAHDPERLLALYAPDAVYEEVPTNTVARGHDEIRAFFEFNFATFSDIEVRPEAGSQAEGWAAFQGVFAGRYTGQLPDTPPGAGQAFAVRFATVFELEGDTIRRNTDYFDLSTLLVQIGALPAPGGAAAPAAATPTA